MAQGKQGIWMLIFPDREFAYNIKNLFYAQGIDHQHREIFEASKIKGYTRVVLGCFCDLLTFEINLSR